MHISRHSARIFAAMMRKSFFSLLFLGFLASCSNEKQSPASENPEDAARNFITSVLHADFDAAQQYIVPDETNKEYLEITKRNFAERMDPEDKRGYRDASIQIHEIKQANDSTSIVVYSNSFKKQKDSLKVIRANGQWLVDLKFSFAQKAIQ